jgi:hypothetical protein
VRSTRRLWSMPARCEDLVASARDCAVAAMKAIGASRTAHCIGPWCCHRTSSIDDRFDDDTASHELAERVANNSVVAAKPIAPGAPRACLREHIEQAPAFRPAAEAGNAPIR